MSFNSNSLNKFIKLLEDDVGNHVDDILTTSEHKQIILKGLNSVVDAHPEWNTCIFALANYTKQKWVIENTADELSNIDVFKNTIGNYDITSKYKFTSDVVDLIDKVVIDDFFLKKVFSEDNERAAFEDAHDLCLDPDRSGLSKYIMASYYERSVITFCKAFSKDIDKILKKTSTSYKALRYEDHLVYHDTEMMLKTIRSIERKKIVLNNVVKKDMQFLLLQCADIISKFPFEGDILKDVLIKYAIEGKTDMEIALQLNRSETFVRKRRQQATDLLSVILWGYASKDILNNMK